MPYHRPIVNREELSHRELRTLNLMLQERSLTRVADALNTTQPTVSKTLARLRAFFHDPLFVRVGTQMHATPKALELSDRVGNLLSIYDGLRSDRAPFTPATSRRQFRLLLTDVGMIHFLPALLRHLQTEASGLSLLAVPMDSRQLEGKLESGEAHIALGAFPAASRALRRQRLYSDSYLCVIRKSHPRRGLLRSPEEFAAERHVLISPSASGHGMHELVARALERRVPADRICLRVPSFPAIAAVVMQTDAVGTLPARLASTAARVLDLAVFRSPFPLPKIEIAQFWHERYQRDPGHRWMRGLIATVFRGGPRVCTPYESPVAAIE